MPQQVPISNSEQLQETKQQVVRVDNATNGAKQDSQSATNETTSNDIKTNTLASTLQQRINASSNCNQNNNNGATIAGKNNNINHDHPNANSNSNGNTNAKPTAATTKLNGLKNRIIQRPPPLILDKVSNFYDNATGNNNYNGQQATTISTATVANASSNSGQIINCNNYVNQNQQHNQLEATAINNEANINLPNQNTIDSNQYQIDADPINNQSNYNAATSANQKFWASLNENASRNKALANARSTTATSEQATNINKQAIKDANGSSSETLGVDLIISHRNSCGTLSTSQIISSSSTRRQSLQHNHQQQQQQPKQLDSTYDVQDAKQHQPNHSDQVHHQSCLNKSPESRQRQHDVSNNSTEPDDGHAPSDHDGGNLIGVDNSPPPILDEHRNHHRHFEEPPTSASSSRRSNNPFLDHEDEEENISQHSREFGAQQVNNFHKRPASFIAATEKFAITKRSSDFVNQQLVEEQFNELQLDERPNDLYSTRQALAENQILHRHFNQTDAILNNQQNMRPQSSSFDQRDSTASQAHVVAHHQNNAQYHQLSTNQLQQQPIYGISNGYNSTTNHTYPDQQTISLDSESAICQPPPSATMQLPHWTDAIYELKYATLEVSSVAGGAENGQFVYIIETGDIILEIDHVKVSGFTLVEFVELIDSKQFHLRAVQTKHSRGLTLDLKLYLNLSFPKNSEDKQLQNLIRENIYRRTIPCTTRPPKPGEIDKVDYHFLTKENFVDMNNRGMLLECGVYSDHFYGTMKPSCDLNSLSIYQSMNDKQAALNEMQQQQWDVNHPAVDNNKRDVTDFDPQQQNKQLILSNFAEPHPLYENHESLQHHQQQKTTTTSNFEIMANQNGLQLDNTLSDPVAAAATAPLDGLKQSSIVAVDSESLPPGWERVIDQTHGTYYIDHNTQRTQYERPYEIELTKGQMGFGFTLVEADNGLLLVRNVIPGGPAHLNGLIKPGDILVSAVGVSVAGLQHTDIARLFSTFAVGDRVRLTFARSAYVVDDNLVPDEYLFSNGTNGDLAIAVNSNSYFNDNYLSHNMLAQPQQQQQQLHLNQQQQQQLNSPHILVNQEFEFISVKLKRGDQGFGFTISDSIAGQKVRKIQNDEICSNLKQGDILTVLNDEDITKLTHKEVVEKLKGCPAGQDVTLTVKRKKRFRSKTPMAMHTDQTSDGYSLDSTPQRNCKTPSLDGIMLRRPINYNSNELPVSRNLFSNQASLANTNQHSAGFLTGALPVQTASSLNCHSQPPGDARVYAPLLHHNRPQPLIPQPIYGTTSVQLQPVDNQQQQQDIYYSQQQSLPPLPSHVSEFDLNRPQQANRPASIPSSEGNYSRANMTNSVQPSESFVPQQQQPPPLPPTKLNSSNMNGLSQLNQYNNFMNNDKLVMMQMQQQKYGQPLLMPPGADYHQMPLYSNSEVMNHQPQQQQHQQPQVPIKPPMNQYMPSLYQQQLMSGHQFQNNLYANNEEIILQRAQYGDQGAQFVPTSDQFVFMPTSDQHQYGAQTPHDERDEYEYHQIDLDRENTDSNWGIRLIGGAEVDRAISIGSIVNGGAASKNGKLKSGDEIISINDVDVVGATHQHVVELISTCTNRASLVVRRKKFAEACEVVLTRNSEEGFGFVIISSGNCALIGKIMKGSPADRCQQLHVRDRIIAVNGRYITPDMQHPEVVNMIKVSGSMLRLRIIPIDCYTVELIKNSKMDNFGFSMRGGSEYDGTPLYILRVAPNGLARDLLNVGDQILEINNIPTVGMTHQQAATIIKYSDPIVKLKLRRNYVTPPSLLVDSPRALQKINSVTAEMKTVNPNATPNMFINDATSTVSSEMGAASVAASISQVDSFALAPANGNVGLPNSTSMATLGYHHNHQQPMSLNGTTMTDANQPGDASLAAQHNTYTSNNQSLPLYAT